jgi:hypothetical protein
MFLRAAAVAKAMKNMRIGQIGYESIFFGRRLITKANFLRNMDPDSSLRNG